MRAAAITIDVDSLRFYEAIHGLATSSIGGRSTPEPIYARAVPRCLALLEEVGVPATFFLIGQEVARYPRALAPIRRSTCEVASHSHRHDYRLSRAPQETIDDDLTRAERALSEVSPGGTVVGFRAPGYNVSPALMEALVRRGYRYDSSLLPAPMYWAGRAAAIGRYAVGRRPSASMVGDARQFMGPLRPYRFHPRAPWAPASDGPLVELPMAVHPRSRWPLIGTTWVLSPQWLRRRWLKAVIQHLPVIIFEMHAIDLLDATDPGLPPQLHLHQPDLRVPFRSKRAAFLELFRRLADARPVQTLRQIAERVAPRPDHA